MADRMDVNRRVAADDALLKHSGHRMKRAVSADAIIPEDDLVDFRDRREEGSLPVTPEGQSGWSNKEPTVSKHKKFLVSTLFQFHSVCVFKLMLEKPRVMEIFTGPSSPAGSQQQPHDTNIEDLRSCLDAEQKINSDLNTQVKKAQSRIHRLEKKYNRLVEERNDAQEEYQALSAHAAALHKDLESEKQDHRKDVSRLEDQIRTLTRTSDQLRQMLVPVSEKQTHDMDVIAKFNTLNKSIIGLTRQTWKTAFKPGVDFRRMSGPQQHLLGPSIPISYDRLQSLVFMGIDECIFGPQQYFLGRRFREMEEHIQEVEKDLNRNMTGDDRQRILEWRDATFKVTESFRDNGSQLALDAQHDIWDFFSVIDVRDAAAERAGQKKLKEICENAAELSVMIRQLKDYFNIDNLASTLGKPVSEFEEWAEEFACVPAPAGCQPGTIAYVIHGALMKSPKENLERVLVLQKALVAVFE
ncbi:hypothetical protein KVR01_008309 [Diaporthe batatas]|uniref:uncharacterized protein n=1 Tax=Diaporthe batatas TaxID=748121 RepID=UPI001D053232|nr:uncharacterized protein KVR01_008309 [Diaporthe batatas]KAG8162544.1 hypothetical protein KVR01_008309 [Diaporthe batatas]